MLLFLSDLHLTDDPATAPLAIEVLVERLRGVLVWALGRGVEEARLVLLGDIFELLKSERWLSSSARPWKTDDDAELERVVTAVFEEVVKANHSFFEGLRDLHQTFAERGGKLEIVYIPGNHDREMNQPSGRKARARLRELLPLSGKGEGVFPEYLSDVEHETYARHGHEWDPLNRYLGGKAAIGDAVVIELVTALPTAFREALSSASGHSMNDPRLRFLEHLDCVRPQIPRTMAQWILTSMEKLQDEAPGLYDAFRDAVADTLEGFQEAFRDGDFRHEWVGRWWVRFLRRLVARELGERSFLRSILWLPIGGGRPHPHRHEAQRYLRNVAAQDVELSFVVCGHTHVPSIEPLWLGGGRESRTLGLYLNTGTWRRVLRPPYNSPRRGPFLFGSWREECLLATFSRAERARGLPAYEVRRFVQEQEPKW